MSRLIIDDFKLGLDVRRSVLNAPDGSLQVLDNCFINAGGEIEKRMGMQPWFTLPANTFGMVGYHDQIHVFGFYAQPGIPAFDPDPNHWFQIVYHQLNLPIGGNPNVLRVLSVEQFEDKFLVATIATNGEIVNYYDGVQIYAGTQGNYFRLWQSKVYRLFANALFFAGVNDPTVVDPDNADNPGAGFIDLSGLDSETYLPSSMEIYYDKMAVFSRFTTQLWKLDPDPSATVFSQLLRIGCVSPGSTKQFGTGDVLFLSDSGVRSLRAINASMAAAVNDVGSPIDQIIMDEIVHNYANAVWAQACIQPVAGRYWLAIGPNVYVLSYYPSAKISAWSRFPLDWPVDYLDNVRNRVILRSGDQIYMYGGPDSYFYDNCTMTVETAMMAADEPTVRKKPVSIDLSIQGTFQLYAGMMTNNPSAKELVGTLAGQTFSLQSIPYAGYGTHFGLRLTCSDVSRAVLSSAIINFNPTDTK